MKFCTLTLLIGSAVATAVENSGFCCHALSQSALGNKVVYPASKAYETSIESYWSDLAQISPTCIVRVKCAKDVSLAVKTLVAANKVGTCQFAIRGGGHTPWAGASNIQNGVTIDLSLLNKTVYNKDQSTASVEPGVRWQGVYEVLDKLGVAIPGGRAGTVGVAGLTLGGGNSFFAARYGLVCDNVANFEIVLANGTIINANPKVNTDLFKVLKGGSNNFGIVTRFDFYAFKSGNLWGGVVVYPNTTTHLQIPAFVKFGNNIVNDPYGSLISLYSYNGQADSTTIVNAYEYTKPVVNAPPFKELLAIPGALANTMRITNLTDLTGELEQAYGFRDLFFTLTFDNNVDVYQKSIDILNNKVAFAKSKAKGTFNIVHLFQPIPTIFSQHSLEKGGNVLGLDRAKKNLILFQANYAWKDPQDDALFDSIGQSTIDQLSKYAKSIHQDNEYIYLDYAYKTQNPLRSYGADNVALLRSAAEKYDPTGVFQKLVPGGFKLASAGTF